MEFDIHLMDDLITCVEASDVIFAASGAYYTGSTMCPGTLRSQGQGRRTAR